MQVQNLLLVALSEAFGNLPGFLYNRVQSVYLDCWHGGCHVAQTARVGIFTYTTQNISGIEEVHVWQDLECVSS